MLESDRPNFGAVAAKENAMWQRLTRSILAALLGLAIALGVGAALGGHVQPVLAADPGGSGGDGG